ncbi:hypothetical protein HK102_011174, partial [Quaeritorhiza haematococci]
EASMNTVRYQWSDGARYSIDPAPVGKAIESLGKKLGKDFEGLTAEDVVEEARSERSPLHPLFTWDDTEAAEQWRREQARCVIRCLRIVVTGSEKAEAIHARVAVRPDNPDGSKGDRVYVPTTLAGRNESLRRQMLDDAIAGLDGWRKRYAVLQGENQVQDEAQQSPPLCGRLTEADGDEATAGQDGYFDRGPVEDYALMRHPALEREFRGDWLALGRVWDADQAERSRPETYTVPAYLDAARV